MTQDNSIEEIFFRYLLRYQFREADLDYSLLQKHIEVLQVLSQVGHSGISVFDISKLQVVFYSSNYGSLLGYNPADFEATGQKFFDGKIHPDDKLQLSESGITILKLFDNFSIDEKKNHKLINEYRMLNAQNNYVRLVEQHQVLELDRAGQLWLMLSFVDISPDQESYNGIKSQLLNFRTGNIIPVEAMQKAQLELTKREKEVLELVKKGLLSKEISGKLSISVHTVNTHRQRVLEKLGANNSMEAVIFASKFGLVN
ncbi:MAG: LuxR C-terminal-related transcriptional regulator [Ferruginibacter sp.]